MKYFKPHEFQCCCKYDCGLGFAQMNPDFLEKIEFARMLADVPFSLNSAIRCEKHNSDVGGSPDSSHMLGLALDIRTPDSRARYKILYGLIKAGFNRIGIYETFIHVDDDKNKVPQVTWFSD